jgi:hypothetical protein
MRRPARARQSALALRAPILALRVVQVPALQLLAARPESGARARVASAGSRRRVSALQLTAAQSRMQVLGTAAELERQASRAWV